MHTRIISKITAALVFLAAFSLPGSSFAAQQPTKSETIDKGSTSSTSKKLSVKTRPVRRRKPRQRAQMAPTAARISEIQSALAAQGAYKGHPNGKWDPATVQAMKEYQSAHGLTATGKLDALTLQKLGLGSEIAGRAAPLAPAQPHGVPASGQQQTP
jgi:peptidoglycan hydrolase-like protein with peptidoglycan-binding domain